MISTTFFARYVRTMNKNLLFLAITTVIILIPPNTVNADWLKTNGINAVNIFSLEMSGSNIFAGSNGGGVFLSTNNGTSWTAVNSGLTRTSVYTLAVSGGSIFAGTAGGGVFLSTNNGTSWTAVNNGLPANPVIFSLLVSDSNIFAGSSAGYGVYLSTNNGTNWTAVNSGLPMNTSFYSLAVKDSNIFAGGGGVFLSTNNGTIWKAVNNGLPANTSVWSLAVSDSNIFAGTASHGIYLSTNNGATWRPANTGLTDSTVRSLTVDRCLIFAGTYNKGVFLSVDNGTTWKAINEGLTDMSVGSVAVNDSTVFAGTLGGSVWRRPLSEMVGFTKLSIKADFKNCDDVLYNFSWSPFQNVAWYELYCNNVLFHQSSFSNVNISLRELLLNSRINYRDTVTYYVVARSISYDFSIIGVSNFVSIPVFLPVCSKTLPLENKIRMSHALIDCSSLNEMVRLSLYSLNGAKVWSKQGVGVKAMVPNHLPHAAYTLEVTGGFGKTRRVFIRE